MAVDRKQQMKRNHGTVGAGRKGHFYIGNVHDISTHDGKIPQLQLQ